MKSCRQSGYTFVELAIVMAVLGLVAMLVAYLYPSFQNLGMQAGVVRNQQEVREALLGFAYTHGRLPYADTDNDGLENAGAATGHLPYRTLGLSAPLRNAEGLDYMYGVYSHANASPQLDANLELSEDRFYPVIADGLKLADNPPDPASVPNGISSWGGGDSTPGAQDSLVTATGARTSTGYVALGNINQLDYCKALDNAQQDPGDVNYLHVGTNENVAYVLVDPGAADMNNDGNPFDGVNGTGLGFESPTKGASTSYDDTVMVGYFNDQWERMGCAGLLSASGHAHPNVLSTTAMFRQSLQDTKYQVRLMFDMAAADELQADASLAVAVAGLATAIATMETTIADDLITDGATSGASVADGIAIGLNSVAIAEAGVNLGLAITNVATVKTELSNLEDLINQLEILHNSVKTDVQASDHDAFSNQ